MNKRSRILMIAAALLLLPALFIPIWKIDLKAPQYPEGLGLYIWSHQVTGVHSNDLNTLNGLNHYIGMKAIDNDTIPELKIMPYIIVAFSVLGLLVAFAGKRKLIPIWLFLIFVMGAAGLYDFYLWGYDYGHDLNPNAPIKVPGLSYQPPLIGSKQLLNMTTTSLPYIGSLTIGAGFLLALFVYFRTGKKTAVKKELSLVFLLLTSFFAINCANGPKPIDYGEVNCAHCEMTIMDQKFGAELITEKGKAYFFDSAECLIDYLAENPAQEFGAQLYVTDYADNSLISAATAIFFISPQVNSPMGGNLAVFSEVSLVEKYFNKSQGKHFSWQQIKAGIEN